LLKVLKAATMTTFWLQRRNGDRVRKLVCCKSSGVGGCHGVSFNEPPSEILLVAALKRL
jgi:hypothetical protein